MILVLGSRVSRSYPQRVVHQEEGVPVASINSGDRALTKGRNAVVERVWNG